MDKSETFWDKIADTYDQAEERFEPIHKKVLEGTQKYLTGSEVVLDYGCATGTKAFELAGKVKEIQGIDISSKMIKIAERRLSNSHIRNIDFTQTTLFDERFKNGSFDVILAFAILHGLENHRQVIKRITELLKPEGLFISATPCLKERMLFLNKVQMYFYLLFSKTGMIPVKLSRFRFVELDELIVGGHFQIIETEIIFHKMSSYFVVAKKI
jgi:2-polyprenyl-3-methyl-5-hydroxy-6-metoxy-1,4-benzoquinol methylase